MQQQRHSPGARRHSSHSHENILQMKFQPMPQIDPRYRDSRPFVSSASNIYEYNARRDFFARRRSSSSLQEDIVQSFGGFQPTRLRGSAEEVTIGGGGAGRYSSPTITTSAGSLSDKSGSASRWDVNPEILVEEYDDAKVAAAVAREEEEARSLSSSTKSVFAGGIDEDEIPFIDDDDDGDVDGRESERSEPIYVPQGMQNRDYVAVRKAPAIKNRKTVSFDLVEHTEDEERRVVELNKSKTCGHITHIRFDDNLRQLKNDDDAAVDSCLVEGKLKAQIHDMHIDLRQAKSSRDDSDEHDTDSLSAYFDNDGFASLLGTRTKSTAKPIDEASVALDLSGLVSGSDSTTTAVSPQTPPLAVPESSPKPLVKHAQVLHKELRPSSHKSAWVPTILYDRLAFGNGKVRALRSLFEAAQRRHRSQSSPDLRRKPVADKLSSTEQQQVMRQLRQWSEFGSRDSLLDAAGSQSADDLLSAGRGRVEVAPCKTCAALSAVPPATHRSVPLQLDIECVRIKPSSPVHWKPLPEAYRIRKRDTAQCSVRLAAQQKQQQQRCDCRQYWAQSVPELFARPSQSAGRRHQGGSPSCVSTRYVTVRQLKHAHLQRRQRCRRSSAAGLATVEASDEGEVDGR